MSEKHLTNEQIEAYIEQGLDAWAHEHLAVCARCRARTARAQRVETALQTLPRAETPRDLAARICAVIELRVAQEEARRARMPLIAVATFFSALLAVWFGLEMLFVLEDNGALYFASLLASQPELLSTYSFDAVFALIELLPIGEIALTLFALLTALILAQQLVETARPPALAFK